MKKSTWFVQKAIDHDMFNIWTAHVIDEDCNEFTATIRTEWLATKAYFTEHSNLVIIDLQPYDRKQWEEWVEHADFAKPVNR